MIAKLSLSRVSLYLLLLTGFMVLAFFLVIGFEGSENTDSRRLSVRAIGHDLLSANGDDHSVVPPVEQAEAGSFRLRLDRPVVIDPDALSEIALKRISPEVSGEAFVKVADRATGEIVYEFKIDQAGEHIIPCLGRMLKVSNYDVLVDFEPGTSELLSSVNVAGIFASAIIVFTAFIFLRRENTEGQSNELRADINTNRLHCGNVQVKLTDKEMEIFSILNEREGELVLRDELLAAVWYEKGVITGRSLDTYISRLRKKLQQVSSSQIVNEHGKGYRLENCDTLGIGK